MIAAMLPDESYSTLAGTVPPLGWRHHVSPMAIRASVSYRDVRRPAGWPGGSCYTAVHRTQVRVRRALAAACNRGPHPFATACFDQRCAVSTDGVGDRSA